MSNPSIGSRIRAMDDANDLIVDIEGSWPVTSGMIQGGGGETAIVETNQPQPPEDCDTSVTRINITINTFLFQQFAAAGSFPALSGVHNIDQEILLGHELGHAEYFWQNCLGVNGCGSAGSAASRPRAIEFEDAMRGAYGLEPRLVH